ncbi:flagellin [Halalkaliarchaeum sp. AArc-GB]|uniref:flagellin n=1 Tax=Halalkaliarchaeum sp. AArc-GB TaxID=3074078 RepID=UPI00285BD442|nr:flagellin [Halalkaliarchaeum sp. AArc-GB]MDR5674431.1 flagellin [Halalkaliarchaeum sp. AArc-GB]
MGISVSASTAIIFAGLLVVLGALYPVAANGFDRVATANSDLQDRHLETQNTDLEFVHAVYDDEANTLTVEVNNTGTVGLAIPETTLVVDNELVAVEGDDTAIDGDVGGDGDAETELWLPGETLQISVDVDGIDVSEGDRITVVTEYGVAAGGDLELGEGA